MDKIFLILLSQKSPETINENNTELFKGKWI